jgi:hypothetical protein
MTASFFGTRIDVERTDVVANDLVIDRNSRQVTRLGPRGDNHLPGLDQIVTHLELPDLAARRPLAANESTVPIEQGDLVLLEQPLDAAGQLLDDAVLAREHPGHIDRRVADADALIGKAVAGFLEEVRGVQQRLGRNATNVQAGAAKTRLALWISIGIRFTAGDIETELRGADGGNVATGTTTDNKNVKLLGHDRFPFQPQRHQGTGFCTE